MTRLRAAAREVGRWHATHVLTAGFPPVCVLLHSEDYYGDLDLKSIRKSELLAGIQNSGETRKPPQGKPRPPLAPARPNAPLQE